MVIGYNSFYTVLSWSADAVFRTSALDSGGTLVCSFPFAIVFVWYLVLTHLFMLGRIHQ